MLGLGLGLGLGLSSSLDNVEAPLLPVIRSCFGVSIRKTREGFVRV